MKKINLKFNKENILPITLIGVLVFIFIMVIFTGVTYAYWQKNYAQKEANKIKSGCFSFELTDENSISLTNTSLGLLVPVADRLYLVLLTNQQF